MLPSGPFTGFAITPFKNPEASKPPVNLPHPAVNQEYPKYNLINVKIPVAIVFSLNVLS